ncbi:hypothetical protein [Helicobacter canis]|uniref:ABC transporter permease n=1 Tax=Helicobacter canis NCTC 12740 TaxID=1357399 RepID=V8CKX8_9HELI|nr:hypothetical protein [Helicobacter canis]ETD27406.1 hypothetical protein HMPREF2087_00318 [Helicobacter canis NCTC 12740]
MRRLLHYELKEHYLPLVVLSVVFALCVFGCVGFSKLDVATIINPTLRNLLGVTFGLCIIGAFSAVFLLVVAHIFLMISTFGKSLFGDYGYLLFCLPLGIDTILLAKVLSCFILIGASVCFYGFVGVQALILVANVDVLAILGKIGVLMQEVFTTFDERSVFIILLSTTYILGEILTWLMYILLTLALLNVWRITSYRLVLGLLLFLGICLCGSVISTLLGLLFGVFFHINIDSLAIMTQSKIGIDGWLLYTQKLITYLLLSGASYLLARHCIIKKMELE